MQASVSCRAILWRDLCQIADAIISSVRSGESNASPNIGKTENHEGRIDFSITPEGTPSQVRSLEHDANYWYFLSRKPHRAGGTTE